MALRLVWVPLAVVALAAALAIGILAQDEEEAVEEGEEGGEDEGVIVETPLGFIRGVQFDNILNGSFFAFFGIPYAKPPIGPLRFLVSTFNLYFDEVGISSCILKDFCRIIAVSLLEFSFFHRTYPFSHAVGKISISLFHPKPFLILSA